MTVSPAIRRSAYPLSECERSQSDVVVRLVNLPAVFHGRNSCRSGKGVLVVDRSRVLASNPAGWPDGEGADGCRNENGRTRHASRHSVEPDVRPRRGEAHGHGLHAADRGGPRPRPGRLQLQKGGVENANGRLRRWLPRQIDIDKVSKKMPRFQDTIPGDPQRAWQRRANPGFIDPLHLAPESTLDVSRSGFHAWLGVGGDVYATAFAEQTARRGRARPTPGTQCRQRQGLCIGSSRGHQGNELASPTRRGSAPKQKAARRRPLFLFLARPQGALSSPSLQSRNSAAVCARRCSPSSTFPPSTGTICARQGSPVGEDCQAHGVQTRRCRRENMAAVKGRKPVAKGYRRYQIPKRHRGRQNAG